MKKLLFGCVVLTLMLAACAPQKPTEPPTIIIEQPTQTGSEMTPAEIAALTVLSETLDLPADEITLVSTEAVTWRDGCLGIVRIDVMCTQAEVPGYKIIFEANGNEYEVHTNRDGKIALVVDTAESSASVEEAVVKQLAQNLGLKESDISVVSDTGLDFPDSCMGVAMDETMCAQVITPGRIIVLEADGVQYEYHTSEDGSRIQPATLALTWHREGGIAGFCDSLTIFLSGEVYGNQCKSQDGRMGTFASLLVTSEQQQFDGWMSKYGQATLDTSDPKGVADGMTNVVELFGNGSGKPGKPIEQDIFIWVQDLFQRLYSKEPGISFYGCTDCEGVDIGGIVFNAVSSVVT